MFCQKNKTKRFTLELPKTLKNLTDELSMYETKMPVLIEIQR